MLTATSTFFRPSPIKFAFANHSDLPELAALCRKTYEETYRNDIYTPEILDDMFGWNFINRVLTKELNDKNCIYVLCKDKNIIIGYAKIILGVDDAVLDKLYFLQKYHGLGLGQKLLSHTFQLAHERGYNKMNLSVYEKNTRAIAFYERNGFRRTGENHFYVLPTNGEVTKEISVGMVCEPIFTQAEKQSMQPGLLRLRLQ